MACVEIQLGPKFDRVKSTSWRVCARFESLLWMTRLVWHASDNACNYAGRDPRTARWLSWRLLTMGPLAPRPSSKCTVSFANIVPLLLPARRAYVPPNCAPLLESLKLNPRILPVYCTNVTEKSIPRPLY